MQSKKIVQQKHDELLRRQRDAIAQREAAIALQAKQATATIRTQEEELTAIVDVAEAMIDPQTRVEKSTCNLANNIKKARLEDFSQSVQHYTILPNAKKLLEWTSLEAKDFTECRGNAIQQFIHGEIVVSLNRAGDLYAQYKNLPEIRHLAQSTVEFAHVGIMYNNAGYAIQDSKYPIFVLH